MTNKILGTFILISALAANGYSQTTSFTYQGKLNDSSVPANGTYDLQFRLWNLTIPIFTPIEIEDVQVTNGVFTVQLDFGPNVFTGDDRFLEIGVRPGTSTDAYTLLAPKQKITSSPYSTRSSSSQSADSISASCIGCVTNENIQSVAAAKVTGTVANATTAANVSGVVSIVNGGTGSSAMNFVDLSSSQDISGVKSFTDGIRTSDIQLTNSIVLPTCSVVSEGSIRYKSNGVTIPGLHVCRNNGASFAWVGLVQGPEQTTLTGPEIASLKDRLARQQEQIEKQQKEIDELRALICGGTPTIKCRK